jgi:prevent-host-death family protein
MYTFRGDTTLVGVSELRTKFDEIVKQAKKHKVVIEKRNKCKAVLLDMKQYSKIEKLLEELSDVALGYLAYDRDKKSKKSDYIDINKVKKELLNDVED